MMRKSLMAVIMAAIFAVAFTYGSVVRGSTVTKSERSAAAQPSSTPAPFAAGEELIYEGEFSKLLLRGIKIAEFRFTAGRALEQAATRATGETVAAQMGSSRTPLLLTGDVVSRGLFRKLFGINFHYHVESFVEPNTLRALRTTTLDEQGKRVRTAETIFDRERNQISWTERDPNDETRPPRVVKTPLDNASFDLISALYYLRTQRLAPGRDLELVMSDAGRVYRIPVRVSAERKKMKSVVGRVSVVRVDVEMFGKGRLVEDEGKMSIWMTDDARRLPVRARISSSPGTIDITLKKFSGSLP